MILDLRRQGLSISALARQLRVDRKTVRAYIAKGCSRRFTKSRPQGRASSITSKTYLRERLAAYPGLIAVRLWREFKERGFAGGWSVVRHRVRELRASRRAGFDVRFETPAGEQAQVDFARFEVEFVDELGGQAHHPAVLDGARVLTADLGALRCPSESVNSSSLPLWRRSAAFRARSATTE
jgi:transposase